MRNSTFALVCILTCCAAPASAQTVPDIEGQKQAGPPAQDQVRDQPPEQAPAQTQDSPKPAPTGRFSFNRVENGFLRLDSESGQIAFCNAQSVGWACQLVPVDRSALETEIARLRDEVASLRKEVAAFKEPPPPRPPADLAPPSQKGVDVTIKLPTQEDIARVRDFVEDAWRRLVEMITTVQKDMMRKG
ncbi:MAG TPA: hypothetical protein VEH78_06095 [Pseudolabrys sp.]|nr:hypothetical protein [Pseudolabrys sp.]